jgi:hypothetical protein
LLWIRAQDPVAGILVDSSVLKQAKFWISDAFAGYDLHIDLDSFSRMSHLLIGFGLVRILLLDCYKPFTLQYTPEGFDASGITSFPEFAPEFDHSEFGISPSHIMNEFQFFLCVFIRMVMRTPGFGPERINAAVPPLQPEVNV